MGAKYPLFGTSFSVEINVKVWFNFDDILVFCVSLLCYLCDLRSMLLNMFPSPSSATHGDVNVRYCVLERCVLASRCSRLDL